MSVHLEKCSNPLCRRLYELEHYSRCFAPETMCAGVITCPYCRTTVSANPALVYSARPLPKAFEHWHTEDFPPSRKRKAQVNISPRSFQV